MNVDVNALRPRLISVAYRIVNCVADAEDAVQDAFLRLHAATSVRSPEGFLVKATTRRCIDQLRRHRRRRDFDGSWAVEPVDKTPKVDCENFDKSIEQAFALMLERLSPHERAAFFLRKVFGYEYSQIARVVDKSEGYVRQMVCRAKMRLTNGRPPSGVATSEAEKLAEEFIAACKIGDLQAVEKLFAYSDGCYKRTRNVPARYESIDALRGQALAAKFVRFAQTVARSA